MPPAEEVLVLGVGNLILGDEGIGIHVVRELERAGAPAGTALADGGTGGFHLLSLLQEHQSVVFVDAAMDGHPPGTITVTEPRFAADFPRVLSAHEIGLRDLLESASILGPLPRMFLVTVSIDPAQPLSLDLSPPLQAAVPAVAAVVRSVAEQAVRSSEGAV